MPLETRYITVDLVVKGNGETDLLVAALEARGYVAQKHDWDDEHKWFLNISCPHDVDAPETCILRCCEDIESTPEGAKAEWNGANYREFFIGYETGKHPFCSENHLKPETVARAAGLRAGIGIALYPRRDEPEP
ncbi:hypothetical protein DES53_102760 [Roseimicrobium gellanilyticum]|uniref:Uncharacterized protein n=1 Tax=Roseimicrobium gellanilyticum TaxID=748857 RepID=A0A366HSY3_9BACT|nr:hypothetical protein [Roseimicrobium gellanilyticum]RBP46369.1 hypothetical protein DES53_102760 [Roseimicrobium gellanilyticum]